RRRHTRFSRDWSSDVCSSDLYRSDRQLQVLLDHEPVAAETDGDRVTSVRVRSRRTGTEQTLSAPYVIDATETGELLELAGVEHEIGRASCRESGRIWSGAGMF